MLARGCIGQCGQEIGTGCVHKCQRSKGPEFEVARSQSGQRLNRSEIEVARGRNGQGTKAPEVEVARRMIS